MHAVFLVTATHLQHLQPHERGHQIVALENLSQVLPIFRNEIDITSDSKECPVELGDALIACAMLLIQYSWTLDSGEWSSLLDLYGLYHGMMSITISCIDRAPQLRWGSLSPMLGYSPRLHIERCMKDMAVPCPLDAAFLHCLTCTKISDTKPEDTNVFYDPIRRLSSILWALDLDHKRFEQSGLTFAASRYLFTLPHFFGDSFLHLLRLQDGRAQVILLYYFAAVSRLKSDQFWWMRVRAIHMFEHISHSLGNKCVDCTARAYEIFCGEDVDGVENLVISEKSEREATAAELEKERIQQKGFVPCSHGVAKQD
jgi:hypothetical protein